MELIDEVQDEWYGFVIHAKIMLQFFNELNACEIFVVEEGLVVYMLTRVNPFFFYIGK